MKILIAIYCVIFLHYSVSGLTIDAQSEADKCFRKECKLRFLWKIGGFLSMCGSDGKPYTNHYTFDCAQECARKYGLELTVANKGNCEGKPPAWEYWKDIWEN